jgi:diguanylate cyclase (GGDEF)-like protein
VRILIVDDSATMRMALSRFVVRMGHESVTASSGAEGLMRFKEVRPDMVLLDVLMEDMDGYTVAREIRRAPEAQWAPIIFLSSREEDQDLDRGIEAGGDDYLVKPVSYVVLHAKVRAMQRIDDMRRRLVRLTGELEIANQELARLNHSDGLTGIANRRHLDHVLAEEMLQAQRSETRVSICVIDVDHFKAYNDHYGHVMGDECLTRVARSIDGAVRRAGDLAARYGGEEFAVVLPATDSTTARAVAFNIIQAVRALKIPHQKSTHGIVTVSVGVASLIPRQGMTAKQLIDLADTALYRAKETGRNRAVMNEAQTLAGWV